MRSWRTPQRRSFSRRDLVGMHPILHAHEGARPLVYDFKAGDLVVAKVSFKNVQVGDLGTVAEKPARDPSRSPWTSAQGKEYT